MEAQAKERLTGAIILVALLVLLVPELLTGPRTQDAPPAERAVDEPPLRSYTIELGDQPRSREPSPVVMDVVEPAVRDADDPQHETTPLAEPPPNASQQPQSRSAAPPAAPAAAPERVPPPAETSSATRGSLASDEAEGWAIQAGSFTSRANADRLVRQLKDQGFSAFVVEGTSGGRKLYRVRIGPQESRAAAEALASRLRAAGRSVSIVTLP